MCTSACSNPRSRRTTAAAGCCISTPRSTQTKIPGAFGWDNTPSIVPAAAVPTYTGPSTYLLATKYNNYGGAGTGNGQNRMAILDPSTATTDPISGVQTMREVLTILSPTPDNNYPGGVREWCVNTGAFDPATRAMLINNEDGYLYRWDCPPTRCRSASASTTAWGSRTRRRPSAPTARSTRSTTP